MKRLLTLLLALLLLCAGLASAQEDAGLLEGTWACAQDGEMVYLHLFADGSCIVGYGDIEDDTNSGYYTVEGDILSLYDKEDYHQGDFLMQSDGSLYLEEGDIVFLPDETASSPLSEVLGGWYFDGDAAFRYVFLENGNVLADLHTGSYTLEGDTLTLADESLGGVEQYARQGDTFHSGEYDRTLERGRGGIPLALNETEVLLAGDWYFGGDHAQGFIRFTADGSFTMHQDGEMMGPGVYEVTGPVIALYIEGESETLRLEEDGKLHSDDIYFERLEEDGIAGHWQIQGLDDYFYTLYPDGSYTTTSVVGSFEYYDGNLTIYDDQGEIDDVFLLAGDTLHERDGLYQLTRTTGEAGEEGSAPDIAGAWYYTDNPDAGLLELHPDWTYSITLDGEIIESGTYARQGAYYIVTDEYGDVAATLEYPGDDTLRIAGEDLVLARYSE